MTRIVLTRHGEVPGIAPATFRGRADLRLTERGRAQAAATARRIAECWRPANIYTSPLRRCVDTARVIGAACGVSVSVLEALNDIDYGAWQGLSCDEVREREPEAYRRWLSSPQTVRFPQGESLQDLATRAADALRYLIGHHSDDTVVLVGHDSSNRALLLHVLDLPLSGYWRIAQDPCAISQVRVDGERGVVASMNETNHLASL